MVRDFFITKIYNKRKVDHDKTKDVKFNEVESFDIHLNKYNATLLVCTLAYICRHLYYGKVEEIRFEDYFSDCEFSEIFYQLRLLLLLLNCKCKSSFKDYREYKIIKNF